MSAQQTPWFPTAFEAGLEAEGRGYEGNLISGFVLGAGGGSHRGKGHLEYRKAVAAGKLWLDAERIRRAKARGAA